MPQKCRSLFKYGHASLDDDCGLNGTFATHVVIRRGTRVVSVPDEVDDARALLDERRRRHGSIEQVLCVDEDAARLALSARFGAVAVHANAVNGEEAVRDRAPEGIDAVIELAGAAELVPAGVRLLRPGGYYSLAGMVHADLALDITAEQIIHKCLTVRGMHNYWPDHLDEAVRFLSRSAGHYPFEDLVSPPSSSRVSMRR